MCNRFMVFHHRVCAVLWYVQDSVMCNSGLCALFLWYVYVEAFMCVASESKTNFPMGTIKYIVIVSCNSYYFYLFIMSSKKWQYFLNLSNSR